MIKLGDKAKDKVTGFEGAVTSEYTTKYNVRRLMLEPTQLKEDGSLRDSVYFDETILELVQSDFIPVVECDPSPFAFLDLVEDEVTGFRGFVVGILRSGNGCTQIDVAPTTLKDGCPQKTEIFHAGRLRLIAPAEPTKVAEEDPPKTLKGCARSVGKPM